MQELDFELDKKSIDDEGNIEGLAVGYGNVDYGGDQVMPGAIDLTGRKSLPMLLFHDQKRPAGVWNKFDQTSEGLLVKGRFSMSTNTGREAYGLTKDGALGGLSMGYKTVKQRFEGKSRQILQAILHEISLVTIPMNEKTLITSVKTIMQDGSLPTLPEFEKFLREGGFSNTQAKAVAGKGLTHLIQREVGDASEIAEFHRLLRA